MILKRTFAIIVLFAMILTSCQILPTATTVPMPTEEPKGVTPTPEITIVVVTNTATATEALPTDTAIPLATATSMPAALPDYSSTAYLDDRSTPASLILSYANAINRFEYLRAYSYWASPEGYVGSLDAFSASFANVTSETMTIGQITSEGAAGSLYFSVPAAVTDNLNGGGVSKYAVCYVLQLPQPANFGAPPIDPMHIAQYTKVPVDASISDTNILAAACPTTEGLPALNAVVADVNDISDGNYLDNRSTAIAVVSSLLNAVNRKEYVRAYSYWENPTETFTNFAGGYSDTMLVEVTFGTVLSDAGAGQFHYKVPLAEYVTHTNNNNHIYVGCYTLHMANPGMQGTPPFEPMGIVSGTFTEYPVGTDVAPLLATVCN
jgi:hypothetical protein